ncbi:MAG TPA: NAD(P)-dependent oxidoreductase [Actinomycetota bacterium]|nr:NAD(P)-dependent oxidoreductase [Actinomycetota bacterium]
MTRKFKNAYVSISHLRNEPEFIADLHNLVEDVLIRQQPDRPGADELVGLVQEFEVLVCGAKEPLSRDVASHTKRLKVIATLSNGTDNIAIPEFAARGVEVLSVSASNSRSVAEHALAMLLALAKRLGEADAAVTAGLGQSSLTIDGVARHGKAIEVFGKTLGIVGAGSIAFDLARLARPLGLGVAVWTFTPSAHREFDGIAALESDR